MKINYMLSCLVALLFATAAQAQLQPKGLSVNQSAPAFSAKDQKGNLITLNKELKKGSVILVFYRGEWCPFCNRYLKELESEFPKFKKKGASVIAVTPELPQSISKTVEKTKASYPILYDKGLQIMKSYDVAYALDKDLIEKFKEYKIDLAAVNGEENNTNLPVPAVYVINKKGTIVYRFFDTDYKNRAPVDEIIKHL